MFNYNYCNSFFKKSSGKPQKGIILYDSTYMGYLEWLNSYRQKVEQRLPEAGKKGRMGSHCLMSTDLRR